MFEVRKTEVYASWLDGLRMPARGLASVGAMTKTVTSPYDVAEHLRTPEEMAAYLEACMEEADGDAASPRRWATLPAPRACRRSHAMPACPVRVSTRRFPENATLPWTRFSESSARWA